MDITNPVVRLCIEGTHAEFEHRNEDARALYQKAWELRKDDYDACIAAHYVARFQDSLEETLYWNQVALEHAIVAQDERVAEFYPSLYVNLGNAYEILGYREEAQKFYNLAANLGIIHQSD